MAKTDVILFTSAATPTGTNFWAADSVACLLTGDGEVRDVKQLDQFRRRLAMLCDANFRQYMPDMVKLEYGKTFCIHMEQYRIVGFFDQSYRDFIALDYFVKKTQKNGARMNAIYRKVDKIREAATWTKKE